MNGERFEFVVLDSVPLKKHLVATALECGWTLWPYCCKDETQDVLFVELNTGKIGTADARSRVTNEGNGVTVDVFLSLITERPKKLKQTTLLRFCDDFVFEVSNDGCIHFRVGPKWNCLIPTQAKELIDEYNKLNA